jgi:hypothetical protein
MLATVMVHGTWGLPKVTEHLLAQLDNLEIVNSRGHIMNPQ